MKKLFSSDKLYKIFIYVALITLAVSIIVPVAWVFMASIKENSEFYGNPWSIPAGIYLQNFVNAFEQANMGEYVLARYNFKGRRFFNTLFMAGLFINVNYIVVPIFLMLLDWDDFIYELLGGNFFLNNIFVLAIVYAATAIPFTVYLLSGYFKTLPKAYEEAALIDGCGYYKTMVRVMIPMAKPSIITVILFNFLAFWNEYIIALTLLPSTSKTLPVGLLNLMQATRGKAEYGMMYAGLVVVMLPTLILYIIVQKKLTQGMTLGGLKD